MTLSESSPPARRTRLGQGRASGGERPKATVQSTSAKWRVHIHAMYAIYRLMQILHIKLHICAYFHCTFFAFSINAVYIIAYFLHISCILLA